MGFHWKRGGVEANKQVGWNGVHCVISISSSVTFVIKFFSDKVHLCLCEIFPLYCVLDSVYLSFKSI